MKFLKQFLWILLISFLGEVLRALIPLPIPASVYGLVLMLAALITGVLIEIMPVMFIPAAVGLMTAWDALRPVCVPVLVITAATTVTVMAVTGRVTQAIIRREKK